MPSKRLSDNTLSLILFVAAAFWGLYWIPLRAIENVGLHGAWAVTLFNLLPLAVLVPNLVWKRSIIRGHLPAILVIGLFTGLGLTFYATGLVMTSVVRATILFYLTPVWSTLIGYFWLSEKLSFGRVAAIFAGFCGLFLLFSGNDASVQPINIGDLFGLLSGIAWAIGASSIKRWPETPIAASITFQFAVTASTSAILALLLTTGGLPQVDAIVAALPIAILPSLLIMMPTVLLVFWISKILFPGRAGILMMSEVLVAILSATFLLPDEQMTVLQWIGGAAIIGACLVEVAGHSLGRPTNQKHRS